MDACEHINDLGPYLDGELDARRRRALEAHLSDCAACRAELEQLRALSRLVADAPEPILPAQAMWRLHGSVNKWIEEAAVAERAEGRILRISRILTGVAACVLVAGSLWLIQNRQSNSTSHTEWSKATTDTGENTPLAISVTGWTGESPTDPMVGDGGLVSSTASVGELADPSGSVAPVNPSNEGAE